MPRKSADQRKAEIIAAMLRLADELGPDRLSTQAIADSVGISQPAIFRHFRTKDALWLALVESLALAMSEGWAKALGDTTSPRQRLLGLLEVQLRLIEASPAIPAILNSRELHANNSALREAVMALMGRFQALLDAEIRQGQAAGAFRRDLAASDAAVLLIALLQGVAIRWALGKRSFALPVEGLRLLSGQVALMSADRAADSRDNIGERPT